ncbi:chaperonin 10-like protein [Cryomyces antarcticus]|uniref:Enoyl reductase (ER) domain-containing protein n=1 Tax=Cryomyces antarcticus TaxID=329879 RepID=A0ABR0KUZ1_9PEZI|nr:hypothetical protein LTR39_000010 [Cryomyces antarcticus]KAK5132136.1 hypothetical protein LTR16_000016 [Cryomyces antarcticus]
MRAAQYWGNRDVRIQDIPEPEIKPGHVKIRPAFVGICGSDLTEYTSGPNYIRTTPHPITNEVPPITLGHEFSGTVTEVSSPSFAVGQKVVVFPTIYDKSCTACKSGAINMCASGGFIGLSGWGGGLSEAIVVPTDNVLALPEDIPLDIGALVEPLAVAWHAVNMVDLKPQSKVLVIGGGPIGIAVMLVLKARGAALVVVSSRKAGDVLKAFGADELVDSGGDVVGAVKEITKGSGADFVFDCAGYEKSLKDACQSVAVKGTVVTVAVYSKPILFQPNDLLFREAYLTACLGCVQQDFRDVINAIASGAIKPKEMITRNIELEQLVGEGLHRLLNNTEQDIKILVKI